jgi:membrane-bound lytic murein transglycosylase MltF
MQVRPDMASDIKLPNIEDVEDNIHAGVKYLRYIVDAHFNEPGIDQMNRHLFAFAAYRSGSAQIVKLRREAAAAGLDANKWFYNVELMAARTLDPDAVKYVGNIFKYYIAYKLALDRARERDAIKRKAG